MVDVDYDEEPSDWLVDWLVHQARLVGLERLPVPAHQRVIDLFEQRTNHRQLDGDTVAFDPLDFELAQLLFDSRQGLTLAGTRGVIDEIAGYELAYTSEAADVVIQVEMTSSTTSTIHGQILARIATLNPAITAMDGDRRRIGDAVGDELGRFVIGPVPHRSLDLFIDGGRTRLLVRVVADADGC